MHFLIDASLPRSLADRIRSLGHEATDVRDIGLRHADDALIAAVAKREGMTLLTRDTDFGDVRNYPPAEYAGIVVVRVSGNAPAKLVVAIIEGFLQKTELLAKLSGRLAILEPGRVRLRIG